MAGEIYKISIPKIGKAIDSLVALGKKINPILRRAARTSSTPIIQLMKSKLQARGKRSIHNGKKVFTYGLTGLLKKSIGSRVKSRGSKVFSDIGPRYAMGGFAFKKWHKPTKSAKAQTNVMVKVNPVLYAHLVDQGFTAKLFGTGKTKRVMGIQYVSRSYAVAAATANSVTDRVLKEELTKAGSP